MLPDYEYLPHDPAVQECLRRIYNAGAVCESGYRITLTKG